MATEQTSSGRVGPYRVGLMTYKVIAWLTIILFVPLTLVAFHDHAYGPALAFLGFASAGGITLAMSGHLEIDDSSISHHCAVGKFRMLWSDIVRMEQGSGILVLIGDSRRFIIPLDVWSGPNKHDAWQLLVQKIQESGTVPMPSNTAGYKWHKNVRVQD
jgi:hypothetical protein